MQTLVKKGKNFEQANQVMDKSIKVMVDERAKEIRDELKELEVAY